MPNIDNRVVKMEFDNAAFERNVAQSLGSLKKLQDALKFDGASKGLQGVSDAASKVDFGPMGVNIEGISKKFLALSTVAVTVLSQITSSAISAGANLIKAFTFQPAMDGFHEYETNLQSIQTILANTASAGTTLDQVTGALDQLNTYSDQTIYNFAEMARNIGTFTAAGVDLNTSVESIKGIANLAALSGSSADQASTAMYQLSQAIASGSVKLMDWNSVVNAGMGGQVFQESLFNAGKALGTLVNVPVDQTFQQWKDAGNTFRDSLQDGWITADVLTTTLAGFTGDLTQEMLTAKGFTQDQAAQILKTAQIAKGAATEVKTFTQLLGTVKEAVGTGWADSFRILLGNFTEAKTIWTGLNNAIGAFVSKTNDARNTILAGWAFLSGRTIFIDALKEAFHNLMAILAPIKEAFKEIFPPTTAKTLLDITYAFARFAGRLQPSTTLLAGIKDAFRIFFSTLSIGWAVLKAGVKFFYNLFHTIVNIFGPGVGGVLHLVANAFVALKEKLVDGKGITNFFDTLSLSLSKPIEFVKRLVSAFVDFFKIVGKTSTDAVSNGVSAIGDRLSGLSPIVERLTHLWDLLKSGFQKAISAISDLFSGLWNAIAKSIQTGDFNTVLDVINVGLLGGIVALLAKFFKDGIKIDLTGGLFDKLKEVFSGLTDTLGALQTKLKADALMSIAKAIGVLTASVVILSLIDSESLAKALTAMAVGFGELIASFAALTKLGNGPKDAVNLTSAAVGMTAVGGALLILAGAAAILASLDPTKLAQGLAGMVALLGAMAVAIKPLSANSKGLISAGLGVTLIGFGLIKLAGGVKIMSSMSWEDMTKGLLGITVGLAGIVGAVLLISKVGNLRGVRKAILSVATSMILLSVAIKIMATLSWGELVRGLFGMGLALGGIVLAMRLMPDSKNMLGVGSALLGMSVGLLAISIAIKNLGKMSWEELIRGLIGIAAAMAILVISANTMEGALPGAGAVIIVAGAMLILGKTIKMLGSMSWGDLIKGLLALTVGLALIAAAGVLLTPVIPEMLALGVALTLLGVGAFLIAGAIYLVVKALGLLVDISKTAIFAIPKLAKLLSATVVAIIKGIVNGIIDSIVTIGKAAPIIAKSLGLLLEKVIETLIKLIPRVVVLMEKLIDGIIKVIVNATDKYIEAGWHIVRSFLKGIEDNIGKVVHIASKIITNFLDQFAKEIPKVVRSLVRVITTWFTETARGVGKIAGTILFGVGVAFIEGFLEGMTSQLDGPVFEFISGVFGTIIGWLGDTLSWLWQTGVNILTGLLNGLVSFLGSIGGFFFNLFITIVGYFGNAINWLLEVGGNIIQGLLDGMVAIWDKVTGWAGKLKNWLISAIKSVGAGIDWLVDIGKNIIHGLWNGMKDMWDNVTGWIGDAKDALIDEITSGFGIFSPSRVMKPYGKYIMEGVHVGMKDAWGNATKWAGDLHKDDKIRSIGKNVSKAISDGAKHAQELDEFHPVITPILDLTKVRASAGLIGKYMPHDSVLSVEASRRAAADISRTHNKRTKDGHDDQRNGSGHVKFEQNIFSPKAVDAKTVYKQTRNLITVSKEELSIP